MEKPEMTAPDMEVTSVDFDSNMLLFQDLDGTQFSLRDFQDKILFINYWATWCNPCLAEMPNMAELYSQYKDNNEIVFLYISKEEAQTIIDYIPNDESLKDLPKYKIITDDDLTELFKTSGKYINRISEFANELNLKINGNKVTFIKNRNINYTNQCYFKCGFCGFSKGPKSLDLKEVPYSLDSKEVVERSKEAYESGASEVCLQGGIHPNYTGEFYLNLVKEIKEEIPDMHIHGFTPLEIWQGAETINKSIEDYLSMLKDAGQNTLPGTAAEILDDRIRKYLCPDKITSKEWAYVMEVAHSIGIKSTATIMFGHIDDIKSWTNHYSLIRQLQSRTRGFTEVVPLPFVHMGSPIYLQGKSMPGPTWDEIVLIHSLARIYFNTFIDNIQASWVKLGHDGASNLLKAGVNDLGGTLINENISRASGASHGQETTDHEFINLIKENNKKEKEKCLIKLEPFLDKRLINKLRNEKYKDIKSSKNFFSAFIILLNIFINPYGLEIKKDKNHIYEKTGMYFYRLRKIISFNK